MVQNSKTLFIFPGQGSQYPGMAKDWFDNFKETQLSFEEASDHCGLNLKRLCFEGNDSDLKATEITQPAILTSTVGIWRAWTANFGVSQSETFYFAGHSLGEYSALVCSRFFDLGPTAKVVRLRGKFMQEAVPEGHGTMAALMFKPKTAGTSQLAEQICERARASGENDWVEPANFNTPEQIVVSGTKSGIQKVIELSNEPQYFLKRALELQVSAPFHSKLMKPASEKLKPEVDGLTVSKNFSGGKKYIPNVSPHFLELMPENLDQIRAHLVSQVRGAVRWIESIQNAKGVEGISCVQEVGPGAVLSGLVKRIDPEITVEPNIDRFEKIKK
jgi:[acyl-carrier-protein] S-malonyltransferase